MTYCVDTSAWLDGWVRYYPPDVFPTLWGNLEAVVTAGDINCSEEVYVETSKKADELHEWIKDRKEMLVPLTPEIQRIAADLLRRYPRLVDTLKGRSQADPFVVATAIETKSVVVTGEVRTGNLTKPRIPDVCEATGTRWITFLQMIRELGLTF
jgi:predicted nucleic acid-binding protein